MTQTLDDIWLTQARIVKSPNFNERPDQQVNLLVIHNISLPPNQFGGTYVEQFFTNQLSPDEHPYFAEITHLEVSAHLFIRRNGELIQFVPLNKRAWHAGRSCHQNRENCNDFSIGIELEGADHLPYTEEQYQQLVAVTQQIQHHYPMITDEQVVGHCHIAPERKTDPGDSFNWAYYFKQLTQR
ncbi:AmpD protein [Oceanospirillum multiglobuliferum]|uniref:1,6-anhydro-N-acetylmuramyl-L-alanine amidase AmpD n=1 Tax=Oceanospirillum multiglobuliferum TaxID=64969 RepID=A0A1T4Q8E4_9GAMM|nr:1,6-anhydro-N-acetylmuramyl-L-alanine amidase AmpD [Oceanospirillum multiglobuliferum]OPX56578.1 N-acetylmuramoyl-L-alanine amidase [Oceanospirillum multiglobuliferum]SJZ99984.1 AmpD protein [Oceanospirillum multiglobuliferum]